MKPYKIYIFTLVIILMSPASFAESSHLESLINALKTGEPIKKTEHSRTEIEYITFYKMFYLMKQNAHIAGVCGNAELVSYNYDHVKIDSLTINSGCDTDGSESEHSDFRKYTHNGYPIYHIKTTSVKDGYKEENITKLSSKEYLFNLYTGKFEEIDTFRVCKEVKFPELSKQHLLNGALEGVPLKTLQIMRNEIFATYGFSFTSDSLSEYFYMCPWYKPTLKGGMPEITAIEKENVRLIKQQELKLKSSSK